MEEQKFCIYVNIILFLNGYPVKIFVLIIIIIIIKS